MTSSIEARARTAALLAAVGAEQPNTFTARAHVDAIVDKALAENRVVGAVVLIAQDGRLVYRRAAGLADREAGRPMQVDAIFRLASLTKPVVTAAAMALVERGTLGLDQTVAQWLPDFRPLLAGKPAPPITIRHLLTHTAGLSYAFMEPADGPYRRAGVSDGLDQPGLSFEEALRRIAAAGLIYPPGQNWAYSTAIDVLGAVLEKAAGKPLPQIVREEVADPLGLVDSGFEVRDAARLAKPYADGAPPVAMGEPHIAPREGTAGVAFSPARAFDTRSFPSGGAGMVGTAGDFLAFFEAMRTGGGGIVSPETVKAMMTNQIGDMPILRGPGWGFGFGGAVLVNPALANSPQSPGTWSWGGAYGHSWYVDPGRALTVVGLTNTAFEGMNGTFAQDLVAAAYRSA